MRIPKNNEQSTMIKETKNKSIVKNHQRTLRCKQRQKVTRMQWKQLNSLAIRMSIGRQQDYNLGYENHAANHPIEGNHYSAQKFYKSRRKSNISSKHFMEIYAHAEFLCSPI